MAFLPTTVPTTPSRTHEDHMNVKPDAATLTRTPHGCPS